jgi:3D (Asp-Asp-Asp) domain-containing protein
VKLLAILMILSLCGAMASARPTAAPKPVEAEDMLAPVTLPALRPALLAERYPEHLADIPAAPALPTYTVVRRVRVLVTACSPFDPKDIEYYKQNGYEGAAYNIAADPKVFPKGTLMRIPGYRGGAVHTVDSKGGSVIRASTRRGIKHIDVKFKTLYSSRHWGSQWLTIEIVRKTNAI